MALAKITLQNFRNHAASTLGATAHFNLLVGENGAGKTNALEAISLLAPGRGLRRASLAELARNDSGQDLTAAFAIGADLIEQGQVSARLGTYTEPGRPTRRLVRINGAEASASALSEWHAVSWLTPAKDGLFTDRAGARRRFVDRMALAIEPGHARAVTQLETALRERNRLLEERGDARWLDVAWRLVLCALGFGFFFAPNSRLIIGGARRDRSASAGGLLSTARLFGQTLGASMIGILLAAGVGLSPIPMLIAAVLALLAAGCSFVRLRTT